jgi:hypothetical protein
VFYSAAAVKKAFGQRRVISIRFRYLFKIMHCFSICYKILLLLINLYANVLNYFGILEFYCYVVK